MAGELFRVRAKTWNEILDAKDDVNRGKKRQRVQDLGAAPLSSDQILLLNDSGGNVAQGSVLQITDEPLTSYETQFGKGFRWLTGDTPDIDHTGSLAVCLFDHPDGKYFPAQVTGVCPALVYINSTSHRHAILDDNATTLDSSVIGPFRILNVPSGTGSKMSLVALSGGRMECVGKADSAITSGSTGTVSVWQGATLADTTLNITGCLNRTGVDIDSGAWVRVTLIDWTYFVEGWECPA